MNMRTILALAAVAVLGVVAYLAVTHVGEPELSSSRIYDQPRTIEPFQLQGSDGADVTNTALQGQWTLLFTGYTFCPDICPTTMANLKARWEQLSNATDFPVQVWMISVDPQRDDVDRQNMYVNFFGEGFYGVRAEHRDLYPFVRNIGLMYSIPDEGETNYLVNHSAAVILVDPNGHQHAIFRPSHEIGELAVVNPNDLASDFSKIVRYLEHVYRY